MPRGLGDATIAGPTAGSGIDEFSVFESDIKDTAAALAARYPVPDVYIRGAVKFKGTKSYRGDTYIEAQGKLLLGDADPDTEFTDLNGDIGFVNLIPYPQDEAWGILEYYLEAAAFDFDKTILSSFPESEIQFFCKQDVVCIINYSSDNGEYIGKTFCYDCTINLDGNIGGSLSNLNEEGEYSHISIAGSGIIGQPGVENSFYGVVIMPSIQESTTELLFRGSVRTYQSEPNGENDNRTHLGFALLDEVDDNNNTSFATLRIAEDFEPWDRQISVTLSGTLSAPGQYRLASFGGVPNAPLAIHIRDDNLITAIPLQIDVELLPNGEGFDLVLMATQQ
nr:hypothetical protein [Marinicella sp. W31]MDC2876171.1 hypothetical protein [Marinicella sp. W31]